MGGSLALWAHCKPQAMQPRAQALSKTGAIPTAPEPGFRPRLQCLVSPPLLLVQRDTDWTGGRRQEHWVPAPKLSMSISSVVVLNICKQGTECVLHGAHSRQGPLRRRGLGPRLACPRDLSVIPSAARRLKERGQGWKERGWELVSLSWFSDLSQNTQKLREGGPQRQGENTGEDEGQARSRDQGSFFEAGHRAPEDPQHIPFLWATSVTQRQGQGRPP